MRGLGWIAGAFVLVAAAGAAEPAARVIAERRAGMHNAGTVMRDLRADILAGRDVAPLEAEAKRVADWAGRLGALFPPDSDGGDTNALGSVWADRTGFAARAQALDEQARRLVSAAHAGDRAGFAEAYRATAAACGQCHRYFRRR